MATEPLHHPPPRRRRNRHWVRRLLVGLAVLIVLLLIAVQIVLWSPLPRRIAERQVQKELGAAAKIESVSVGWLGTTEASGITITLPMARSPLVHIRRLTIGHDSLFVIPFTKDVDTIAADGVTLDLRQDREGQWNLQQLVENLPKNPDPAPPKAVLELPDFTATDVTVKLAANDGRTADLRGVSLTGHRKPPLDYALSADIGQAVHVEGRMALTRDASHQLDVTLHRVPDELRPLLSKDLPHPLQAQLHWTGRRTPTGIDGLLTLREATAGEFAAAGEVELFGWEDQLVAAPKSLAVRQIPAAGSTRPATARAGSRKATTTRPFEQVVFDGGRVIFGDRIGVQRLRLRAGDRRYAVNGQVDPRNLTADLTAAWDQVAEVGVGTAGHAAIKVSRDLTGSLQAAVDLDGSFSAAGGTASGKVQIRAGGDSLATMYATIETEPITWSSVDGQKLALPAMEVAMRSDGEEIRLTRLGPRDPSLGVVDTAAAYHLQSKTWYAATSVRDLRLADLRVPGVRKPIDLDLDAYGTHTRVDVKDFFLRHGGATYWARGFYDTDRPDPVHLDAGAWYKPPQIEGDARAGFQGLRFRGEVSGTLDPRDLYARGALRANDLQVRGRYIGDIDARVEAHFAPDYMTLASRDEIELLGGRWTLHGRWHKWGHDAARPLTIRLEWKDLPVASVADALKLQGFGGTIEKGSAQLTIPSGDLRDVKMTATASGRGLTAGATAADTLDLKASLERGQLTSQVTLVRGTGRIDAGIATGIPEASPVVITGKLTDWPAATDAQRKEIRDLQAYLEGGFELKYLPDTKAINSNVKLGGRFERGTEKIGGFELSGYSQNRKLTLEALKLRTLGGTLDAAGVVDLQNVNGTNFDAEYKDLDLTQLAWLRPELGDLTGRYSGELHIHPSTDRRPLGPIAISLHVKPANGYWRTVGVGELEATAAASYDGPRDYRLVTEKVVVQAADGLVRPFFRLSSTTSHGLTQLVNLDLENLNLEPMVHAFKPKDREPMPGRVSGNVRLYGSLSGISAVNGEASIRLSNSDLVNFKPVAFLYNLMRVGTAGSKPTGEGRINLRVEQAILRVNSARYFNRGVEITAFGPIGDLEKLPDSPMKLVLVGSARPLKNIKLPFFGNADEIMAVLQGAVTTVEATGTLRDPAPRQAALSEFSDTFKAVLLGIVKDEGQD